MIIFSDFPGNIWVASFMVCAFQGSIKNWFMLSVRTLYSVYRVMDACGKFGEHERSIRVARGDSREQL